MKDKIANPVKKKKIRFKIRDKILISFLAVSLISVGILSVFAIRNMGVVGNTARVNTIRLGESAVAEGIAALEDSGRKIIQLRAQVVAREAQIYIDTNLYKGMENLIHGTELEEIAVRSVGQTGYTFLYGQDGIIYFYDDPEMVGKELSMITQGQSKYEEILENGYRAESAGYYDQEDIHGNIRPKYVYCVPITGTSFVIAATTYIDEFSRPAAETESRITSAVSSITSYIDNQMDLAQWTFIVIIACMIVIIAILATYIARSITEPITSLAKGSEIIASGNLDHKIKLNTGDEIEQLANQFNSMTSALKESYSTLEQKVEERTKELSQRAGQLATINEISRKISSIINLDELLPFVANLLRQTFKYDNVNIFLFEPDSNKLILKEICLSGYAGVIPLEIPLEMGEEGIVAWVAKIGEPLLANDVSKEPRYQFIKELSDTKSELAVPVKIGEEIRGVLDIESNQIDAFSAADLSTAETLADQLAIAIENARLYSQASQVAVMEERNRISREIHDTLAQGFTGIILQLEAAEQALESKDIESTLSHLNRARSLARGSLSEARRSVWNLRPEALERLKVAEAMQLEINRFSQGSNVKVDFSVTGETYEIPPDKETALLRICQEGLANVRKHAAATEAKVSLNFDKPDVVLTISDNGKGMDPDGVQKSSTKKHKGFGLISMRERAKNAGGTFEIQSEPGKGTAISVKIPAG